MWPIQFRVLFLSFMMSSFTMVAQDSTVYVQNSMENNHILTENDDLVVINHPFPSNTDLNYITPMPKGVVFKKNTLFEWSPIENASFYLFELSEEKTFNTNIIDTIIAANHFKLETLKPNTDFFWRIKPLNNQHEGHEPTSFSQFRTSDFKIEGDLMIGQINLHKVNIEGHPKLIIDNDLREFYDFQISDKKGTIVLKLQTNASMKCIDLVGWTEGEYFVQLLAKDHILNSKIIKTK